MSDTRWLRIAGRGGRFGHRVLRRVPGLARARARRQRGDDQPKPAPLRKCWNEYLIFEETLLHGAPAEIRDEVEVRVSAIRTLATLMEKYDFDAERMEREGTAAERALFEAPPPKIQKAQDAQHA